MELLPRRSECLSPSHHSFSFIFSYFRVKKRRACGLTWATPRHRKKKKTQKKKKKKKKKEKKNIFFFFVRFFIFGHRHSFNSLLFIQVDMTFIVALALLAFIGTTNAVCTTTNNASDSAEPGTLIRGGGNCDQCSTILRIVSHCMNQQPSIHMDTAAAVRENKQTLLFADRNIARALTMVSIAESQ
jgi:hypothetical protein